MNNTINPFLITKTEYKGVMYATQNATAFAASRFDCIYKDILRVSTAMPRAPKAQAMPTYPTWGVDSDLFRFNEHQSEAIVEIWRRDSRRELFPKDVYPGSTCHGIYNRLVCVSSVARYEHKIVHVSLRKYAGIFIHKYKDFIRFVG